MIPIRMIILSVAFLLSTACSVAAPSFVVIMTDDQTLEQAWMTHRSTTAGVLGNLIKNGTTFRNSYVTTPLCGPSRATFLTGQYSHNHGVVTNSTTGSLDSYLAFDDTNTLATWLHDAGYRTALIGKYVNGYGFVAKHGGLADTEIPPGWDNFQAFVQNPDYYNYMLNANGTVETHGSEPADYSTTVLSAKAVSFLAAQQSGHQFLLWLTPNAPHIPYTPAPADVGVFGSVAGPPRVPGSNENIVADKPAYIRALPLFALVSAWPAIDQMWRSQGETLLAISDLVDAVVMQLKASGVYGETYLIFTSDNGYMHGEHRLPHQKMVPYEPSIRVPLIVVGPGVLAETVRGEMVANIDLAPTIAELAGVVPGRVVDGKSLVPLLQSQATYHDFRGGLLIELMQAFVTPYINGLSADYVVPVYVGAVADDGMKIVKYPSTREVELYDLARDPYEVFGVQSMVDYADALSAMNGLLSDLQGCVGPACQR